MVSSLWKQSSPRLEGRRGCTYEVNAYCGDVGLGVGVIGKSKQQARLSDARVSDKEELEEVIVSGDNINNAAADMTMLSQVCSHL